MPFTNYSNSGLDTLGQSLGALGQNVANAYQSYQQQQRLSSLGQNLKTGDLDTAMQNAAALDPTGALMLKLYGLKQGQNSSAQYNAGLGALYGGGGANNGGALPPLGSLGTGTPSAAAPTSPSPIGPQTSAAPDTLPPPSPAAGNDTSKQVFDFYTGKGLSPQAAAGLTGRFIRESGLNPGASNPGDGADGSTSIGVGQWNGPRAAALQQFAAQNGLNPNDLQTQLHFSWQELNGPERTTLTALNAAQTPQDAATAATSYERPAGWTRSNPTAGMGYADSVSNANAIFSRFGGGSAQPGTQVAASGSFVPQVPLQGASTGPPTAANPQADPPVTVPGYKGTWSKASAGATEADDSPTVEEVAKAQAAGGASLPPQVSNGIAATAPASSARIQQLIRLSSLPGLSEPQQKTLGVLLQSELDQTKLPDTVKQFKFAQSAAGGGFTGTFQDFKDKTADPASLKEYNAIVADNQAKRLPAPPSYGQWLQQKPSDRIADPLVMGQKREQLLIQRGIDPNSPQGQDFILNGKTPDLAQVGQMKATEQKLYNDAQNKTLTLQQSIADLQKAKELNPQVYSGSVEPGAAAFIHRNVPFGLDRLIVNPDRVTATTQFENLVTGANAALGKELFGARVTNYDEQLLQKLRANPNMAPDERAALLDQMIAHRQETLAQVQNEVATMKAGTRFQRTPYMSPQQGGAPPVQPPQQSTDQGGTPNLRTPMQGQPMPSQPSGPQSLPPQPGDASPVPRTVPGAPMAGARNAASMPQQGGAPIRVTTPADVAQLSRGTHYQSPDGREWIKP